MMAMPGTVQSVSFSTHRRNTIRLDRPLQLRLLPESDRISTVGQEPAGEKTRSLTHLILLANMARRSHNSRHVGVLWAQPQARPVVEPQPTSWLLFLWNLQPLTTPDPLYPVLADMPACPSEQRRNPAIAIAAILASQRNDGLGKRIFGVSLCRPVTLCAAWLFHHTARTPLAHAMRITRMDHRTASSFRA